MTHLKKGKSSERCKRGQCMLELKFTFQRYYREKIKSHSIPNLHGHLVTQQTKKDKKDTRERTVQRTVQPKDADRKSWLVCADEVCGDW